MAVRSNHYCYNLSIFGCCSRRGIYRTATGLNQCDGITIQCPYGIQGCRTAFECNQTFIVIRYAAIGCSCPTLEGIAFASKFVWFQQSWCVVRDCLVGHRTRTAIGIERDCYVSRHLTRGRVAGISSSAARTGYCNITYSNVTSLGKSHTYVTLCERFRCRKRTY